MLDARENAAEDVALRKRAQIRVLHLGGEIRLAGADQPGAEAVNAPLVADAPKRLCSALADGSLTSAAARFARASCSSARLIW